MKNFILLAVISCAVCTRSQAQDSLATYHVTGKGKPHLFDSYAEKISFSADEISQLFSAAVGSRVETVLGGSFHFSGQVVSVTSKYNNAILSVVVRSGNFSGTCLILSRITAGDGTISYTGTILGKSNSDAYVLGLENGRYTMTKKNIDDLMID